MAGWPTTTRRRAPSSRCRSGTWQAVHKPGPGDRDCALQLDPDGRHARPLRRGRHHPEPAGPRQRPVSESETTPIRLYVMARRWNWQSRHRRGPPSHHSHPLILICLVGVRRGRCRQSLLSLRLTFALFATTRHHRMQGTPLQLWFDWYAEFLAVTWTV